MKIKLDIDDDCTDAITVATLKRTLGIHKSGPDPDSAEIAAAVRVLLKYYGPQR